MKLALPAQGRNAAPACECPELSEATADQMAGMSRCCQIKPREFTVNTKAAHLRAALG